MDYEFCRKAIAGFLVSICVGSTTIIMTASIGSFFKGNSLLSWLATSTAAVLLGSLTGVFLNKEFGVASSPRGKMWQSLLYACGMGGAWITVMYLALRSSHVLTIRNSLEVLSAIVAMMTAATIVPLRSKQARLAT